MTRLVASMSAAFASSFFLFGCGGGPAPAPPPAPASAATTPAAPAAEPDRTVVAPRREPVLPPQLAMLAGLLPLRSIGADTFRVAHPTYDGRGVIIAILDSGIDAGVPGLRTTTTGERKILDLRDFSGEGRVALNAVRPEGGIVTIGTHRLGGFGRVARMAAPPYYGGVFSEITLGTAPDGDLNGNGSIRDEYPLIVGKASSGWVLFADTDGDGSLDDERPVHDFAVLGETLSFSVPGSMAPGPMAVAANFDEHDGRPFLDLFMDNSSHGTHVAGIAAGHDMFGVEGFDGVAPGAWLLGLKISNNARGGVSVTGSMLRALNYAADFANRRALPLVVNLSFGVGNEREGAAAIDSLIDEFSLKHPEVLVVISAGNDGPGWSTIGFPGSAELALSVCALFPGVFAQAPQPGVPPAPDVLGWWSGRGGEVAKPDICAPGVAFSNVPPWRTGEEVSGGTSMAAPHVAGTVALLLSASHQQGRPTRAVDLKRALLASATPLAGATVLDVGAGVVNISGAYRWLMAAHQTGVYDIRALSRDLGATGSAAFRRNGLRNATDTLQQFVIRSVGGQPAARLLLATDQPWLRAPPHVDLQGRPETVTVHYDALRLQRPGAYVGTVWAIPATDTIAGPSFGLVNTIVVPHKLDDPYLARGTLQPGATARHFVDVSSTRGLSITLQVSEPGEEATLYVFEPSGQPLRGENTTTAGAQAGPTATIHVPSDDLVPGVYEAVVVAPPTGAAQYLLEAAVPAVGIGAIDPGPRARVTNESGSTLPVTVAGILVGAVRGTTVRGTRAAPVLIGLDPPTWARRVQIDVTLPVPVWHLLTDFGVTVFDQTGEKVSDSPLNYAFGRHTVDLDSSGAQGPLILELLPGFAHLAPPEDWYADVRVIFELDEAIPLALESADSAGVVLGAGESREVQFSIPAADDVAFPQGFESWVEISAHAPRGPRAARRAPGGSPPPATDVDPTP